MPCGGCSGHTFRGGWVYAERPKSASAPASSAGGVEFDLVGRAPLSPVCRCLVAVIHSSCGRSIDRSARFCASGLFCRPSTAIHLDSECGTAPHCGCLRPYDPIIMGHDRHAPLTASAHSWPWRISNNSYAFAPASSPVIHYTLAPTASQRRPQDREHSRRGPTRRPAGTAAAAASTGRPSEVRACRLPARDSRRRVAGASAPHLCVRVRVFHMCADAQAHGHACACALTHAVHSARAWMRVRSCRSVRLVKTKNRTVHSIKCAA